MGRCDERGAAAVALHVRLVPVSLAFALLAFAGCGGGLPDGRDTDRGAGDVRGGPPRLCSTDEDEPPCGPGAKLGVDYRYELLTHCGIEYAIFDRRTWLARQPFDDAEPNPPPGWGNPTQVGVMRLLARDLAEFRADGGLSARFEPAPDSYERPTCA